MKRSIKILTLCCAFVLLCLAVTSCGHEHAYGEWVTVKAPTCTEAGTQERACECGQKETGVLSAIGHKAGADATCTEDCVCTVCDEVLQSEKGHVPGTEATCTAAQTCVVCGAEVMPAKGHAFGEWSNTKEPTCTEKGSKERVCVCGEKETEEIAAKGHTPGAAATCTEKQICTVCNAELAAALGHSGEWVVVKEATKTEDGLKEKICATCGFKESEVLYATGSLGLKYGIFSGYDGYRVMSIGTCTDTEIVIPSVYKGKPVTSIGSEAFADCSSLTSVVILDSITSIGSEAFEYCTSLTSVVIPDSVTSIGYDAFEYCTSLTEVYYQGTVEQWLEISFSNSYSNPCINGAKFYTEGELLTELVIPDSVTRIGGSAFSGCTSLTSVVIPDSVTRIGDYAFYNCSSLTSVVIPDSVTSIGRDAFRGCSSLTSVTIGNGVTSIGRDAFRGCSSLTSVVIPDSVTSIGESAFYNCRNLTSVTIGSGVTSIDNDAFKYCYKLVEVINKSKFDIFKGSSDQGYVAYYALEVHDGESKVVNQDGYLFYTYGGVNYLLGYCGNQTELVLPENYNGEAYQIYQYAFYKCSSLTSVVIPDSVTSIGYQAFYNCYKLVEVINKSSLKISKGSSDQGYVAYYALEVHDGESKVVNQDGYLFYTYDGVNYLLGYCGNETELVLPENYNGEAYRIYRYAFSGCGSLTSVVIPDSVTSIGRSAFYVCNGLTSVTIGSGVTSIGAYAFSIDGYDYYDYSILTDIHYNGTTAEWKAISKGENWKYGVPATKVVCSDGEVYI